MTLTEFLLARIAEDEAVARAAIGTAVFARQTGRWSFETVNDQYGPIPIVFAVTDTGAKTQAADLSAAWEQEERGAHISRHDPARVLAECEAKRRIMELHEVGDDGFHERGRWDEVSAVMLACRYYYCPTCDHDRDYGFIGGPDEGCATLRIIALPYADHPDYLPEWKPVMHDTTPNDVTKTLDAHMTHKALST